MAAEDVRCLCGSLVAKIKKTGIELKCRRCKRIAFVTLLKKEQRMLEKSHPEIFRHQVIFAHPPIMEEVSSQE